MLTESCIVKPPQSSSFLGLKSLQGNLENLKEKLEIRYYLGPDQYHVAAIWSVIYSRASKTVARK